MPKRTDLEKVLIIGSGPIIIGQACEFDYSGSQACKALKEEGYEVILVNSNPATIMTDPEMADKTYIEPLTVASVEKIIEIERPDAILPTLGGQTGLNLAIFLEEEGVLDKYNVEIVGSSTEAIARAEDRDKFRTAMREIGVAVPGSGIAHNMEEAREIAVDIGYPLILRPAYTLGGSGGATVYNAEELEEAVRNALDSSPVSQVLVEQSVLGWKEIEFEVMRDINDSVIIITSMENVDPMGVHTGDSIVVAPAQTLTAREYNNLVAVCKKIIRKIDVTGGGVNIQFGVNPDNGDLVIIEVNPRLSRSSALASKATGFPIARVAAKLAVGYTLDEVKNDITGKTYCFFEPTVDYCVFKISRFTFEKFPATKPILNTSMKAVGEAMAIGRSFKEAFQKGLRSLEIGRYGFGADGKDFIPKDLDREELEKMIRTPTDRRIFYVRRGLEEGMSIDEIHDLSKIDRWFLSNMKEIMDVEKELYPYAVTESNEECNVPTALLRKGKELGFSDIQLSKILNMSELEFRQFRKDKGILPAYKPVDTCAGEFDAEQPYYYSSYSGKDEVPVSKKRKILILGGGPNRIGQGIEFDYCCVHASFALLEENVESIMINSNPETVSTDYDTSDKLYFEPLTREDVLNVIDKEKPEGVIIQFGGQTPLSLAVGLQEAGVPILGTSPDCIDMAEDRKRFDALLSKLDLTRPASGTATSLEEAREVAASIGYPVLVRPSYVLGGRAMEIVYDEESLERYMTSAVEASPEHPVLVDRFLEDAIEVDVDAISDGETTVIGGIMEHIEEAGVHSGDSACVLPPFSLSEEQTEKIKETTYALAKELNVKGLMNIQYALRGDMLYVLEVNPRASRTIPFVSKATGIPLAKIAAKVMMGKTLKELGFTEEIQLNHVAVKEVVFPFKRFPAVDAVLGPEMKSTGEVMGIDSSFGLAFAKAGIAAGVQIPTNGNVFVSVKDSDKRQAVNVVKRLVSLGYNIIATKGTAKVLNQNDIPAREVLKVYEGRPNIVDLIKNGEVQLIINTPLGKKTKRDDSKIRTQAILYDIPLITTMAGAAAHINGLETLKHREFGIKTLQEYHRLTEQSK